MDARFGTTKQVESLLAELSLAHLVTQHTPGRYGFHDLLRAFANELAHTHDPDDVRQAATRRMLDHYLHTAFAGERLIGSGRDPIPLPSPADGVLPEQLAGRDQAMRWFVTERPVLLAAVDTAVSSELHDHAWRLAWSVSTYLVREGRWRDQGEAHTYKEFARLYEREENYAKAINCAQRALRLFRVSNHQAEMAYELNAIGWYQAQLGDYDQALSWCEQSLAVYKQLEDLAGEADVCDSLGYAHHHLGHYRIALDYYYYYRTLASPPSLAAGGGDP
jgi:tetratricopeptide (TPR) repeat protein